MAAVITVANIIIDHFLPYRELINSKPHSNDIVISAIEESGYYKIEAVNQDKKSHMTILICSEKANCSLKKDDFMKMISKVDFTVTTDLLIILGNEIYEKKTYILQEIANLQTAHEAVYIRAWPYKRFVIPICSHEEIPKHILIPTEEVKEFCKLENLTPSALPIILESDPPIVWLGGKRGQYVKVEVFSHTAGKAFMIFRIL